YAGDDTHPAFSPDGQWIAFRSERGGGGIYLMDATGRALRRLTGGGYHPAWSPDGREILCTTENIVSPYNRAVRPRHLWAVNVTTGEKRLITTADVAQPRWSPHGYRIAYWGSRPGAQRDIWTMRPDGGEPLAVTDDAALDWNPVWSPDGRYLYFASDRAGSMNLWRVAIDEQSGRVLSAPELVPTPSAYSQHIAFSGDGRRLAHAQVNARKNVQRIAFDPERGMVVGRPIWITQGSRWVVEPHLSPDGRWLVCSSLGEKQEDLFLIRSDGAGERIPLTQDAYKDRFPCWSPDGKQIAFYSNRSGTWEIWAINAEDRKLRQLTFTSGADAFFPIWSPDGARLAYTGRNGSASVIDVTRPWAEQTPQPVFSPTAPQAVFWPTVWSPDGRKLVGGWRRNRDDALSGLAIYSFESRQFERLTDFGRGNPVWLKDNRRLLFRHEGKVFLVDSRTKKVHEVFSAAPHKIGRFTLSRDNRLLYFDLEETEADIWMLDLDEEQQASGHGASAKSR
ncbi:MAG TPA: hypothetical protein VNO70_04640, partial [Blastocatellia bacterium]|nr:hypothetical protein [Blastocatellia bacterium]